MAPNKLENQIREQLNSREIQPSAQAWDRLDAMLTVAEEKKTKPSYGWLYIAASVLVLLTLGMFLFTQKGSNIQPQNDVVGTEKKEGTKSLDIMPAGQKVYKDVYTPEELNNSEFKKSAQQSNKSIIAKSDKSFNQNNQKPTNSNQNQSNNPLINHEKQIEFKNSSDVAVKDLPKTVDPKPIIVDNRPAAKSDEQLLAGLDNVAKQTASQKSTVKVDAKSLLSQVDGEVEYTFREKVINKISKNYKEVKVALANRNNE
ncbi:hypothetical protein [Flavobacterium wongokense]|uniref:hypothetical protein n=1 Tax=Flavobacterium wongokense TaxID=2910674 RepID=UPI001F3A93C2|nr:hypothetical protein [Flavobacterium sp. WG47]MCF6131016.1 hypothetical protein [Flavobacterium sp. WG47]